VRGRGVPTSALQANRKWHSRWLTADANACRLSVRVSVATVAKFRSRRGATCKGSGRPWLWQKLFRLCSLSIKLSFIFTNRALEECRNSLIN